ncbi:uncharacterized protein MKK02DRAFT_44937 [Dioszegia hungarica]|uniref:Uncharacterized protein n=1 Tax=Dioszegia hungarica TaxID=4972 RepID=A0AA38H8G0_9TREE|nr:uncharacterized protein MKK02DRAFT_44937 [Dioszegia hungarica]KAI9636233.1 hypothetical protein MKK02DRAFT_44937 [Dioszegia hungarica]
MPSPELTHSHSRPTGPATINAVVTLLKWRGLPIELAQRIVDQAQYWTKCTRSNKRACTVIARMAPPRQSSGGQLETWTSGQEDEVKEDMEMEGSGLRDRIGEVWYLCSSPMGCLLKQRNGGEEKDETGASSWIRQVAVETFSRDQGWSDNAAHYGKYEHSYSWFEMSLLRNGQEVPESRVKIQYNVHAGQYFKSHRHVFDKTHPLVRDAVEGDRLVLWARAEYPGWTNVIKEASISVYTAPYPVPR